LRRGHLHTAKRLVALGADANRASRHGVTPLLLAVAGGHAELAAMLLQAGADPNAQDGFGRTALHEAAQRGDLAIATLLLRHGADVTLASRYGTDAVQAAHRTGHDDLLPALRASARPVRKLGAAAGRGAAVSLPDAAPGVASSQVLPSQ
jgi:hypothetical protein